MSDLALQQGEYLLRMLIAAICGGAIGFERKSRMKEAGVRTHLIVALGSALMMIVSKYGFFDIVSFDGIDVDASRIASQIITGVGFLGAGVIFIRGSSISGLTTAAGIWATSGVGLSIGAGMYTIGVAGTIMILCLQILLHSKLRFLEGPTYEQLIVNIEYCDDAKRMLEEELTKFHIQIVGVRIQKNHDGTSTLELSVRRNQKFTAFEVISRLEKISYVHSVEL